jgi:hypothetical protein
MRTRPAASIYQEDATAREEFNSDELRHLRTLLRRLRFLEKKVNENGGLSDQSGAGGSAYAEWESSALAWALTEIGFLETQGEKQ